MKTKLSLSSNPRQGFSLVELLTFIAILGIICSIAVPMLGSGNGYADARLRRNAQEIASTFRVAEAADLDFTVPGDIEATVAAIVKGGTPARGALKGRFFGLRSIAPEEAKLAIKYLTLDANGLAYTGSGSPISVGNRNVASAGNRPGSSASSGRSRGVLR